MQNSRQVLWKRWTCEYTTTVSESAGQTPLRIGDVVILRDDESNRGKWWIEMAEHLFNVRDGVMRTVKPHTGKSFFERPVQHLYQ